MNTSFLGRATSICHLTPASNVQLTAVAPEQGMTIPSEATATETEVIRVPDTGHLYATTSSLKLKRSTRFAVLAKRTNAREGTHSIPDEARQSSYFVGGGMSIQNPLGPRPGGNASSLDITTATIVKGTPGTIFAINVLVAGSAVGGVFDHTLTTGTSIANQIAVIPDVITTQPLVYTWPCSAGIVVVPGTGQTLSVSFA